jgi:hypothetical protein
MYRSFKKQLTWVFNAEKSLHSDRPGSIKRKGFAEAPDPFSQNAKLLQDSRDEIPA